MAQTSTYFKHCMVYHLKSAKQGLQQKKSHKFCTFAVVDFTVVHGRGVQVFEQILKGVPIQKSLTTTGLELVCLVIRI